MAPLAHAADPADVAAAEALFLEGRDSMAEGRYDEACPKFAESQRLDPGAGTALNLAECYEKQGRRATAWGTWLEAANLARQAGQADREEYARSRAKSAEAQLHRLVVAVPEESRVEGLRVTRSGVEVRPGAWGTALPVDPGEYEIEATAPGKVPFRTLVSIDAGPGDSEVVIPALEDEGTPPPAASQKPAVASAPFHETSDPSSARRTGGIIVTSVGVAGVLLGGLSGLRAIGLNDQSKGHCRTDNLCSQEGVDLREEARAAGNAATFLVGIGSVVAVTGAILWLTAPSDGPQVGAVTTADGAKLLLRGSF